MSSETLVKYLPINMAHHSRRLEHSLIFTIYISYMKDYAMQAHSSFYHS